MLLRSTSVLRAGGAAGAESPPRATSPKRNGNVIPAALYAGLAQGGRAPREANAPAAFAGPEMGFFPSVPGGPARLASRAKLSAHHSWVLQVLKPGPRCR